MCAIFWSCGDMFCFDLVTVHRSVLSGVLSSIAELSVPACGVNYPCNRVRRSTFCFWTVSLFQWCCGGGQRLSRVELEVCAIYHTTCAGKRYVRASNQMKPERQRAWWEVQNAGGGNISGPIEDVNIYKVHTYYFIHTTKYNKPNTKSLWSIQAIFLR